MGTLDTIYDSVAPNAGVESVDSANPNLQAINPPALFNGSRLFSQVIVAPKGRTVWISGLIGCTPDNQLVPGGKGAQIAQAFRNLAAAIEAAGCRPEHCVRITEYMVDYQQADLALVLPEIQGLFVVGQLPTNVLVPVPRLGRDHALFEIDAFCVLPD